MGRCCAALHRALGQLRGPSAASATSSSRVGPLSSFAPVDVSALVTKAEFQIFVMFDEAMDHRVLRGESWPMMRLEVGATAWIPYGWIPLVCGEEEINSFIVVPWVNADLFKKTMGPVGKVMEDADMAKGEVDEIVLVG